jgi:hypothetical protein
MLEDGRQTKENYIESRDQQQVGRSDAAHASGVHYARSYHCSTKVPWAGTKP